MYDMRRWIMYNPKPRLVSHAAVVRIFEVHEEPFVEKAHLREDFTADQHARETGPCDVDCFVLDAERNIPAAEDTREHPSSRSLQKLADRRMKAKATCLRFAVFILKPRAANANGFVCD